MATSDDNANDNFPDGGDASDTRPRDGGETPAQRQARIARIRKAIDQGDYDSEVLLERAMKRMIQQIDSPESDGSQSADSQSD